MLEVTEDASFKQQVVEQINPDVSSEMHSVIPSGPEQAGVTNSCCASCGPYSDSLAMNAWLAMHQGFDLQPWFEEQVKLIELRRGVDAGFWYNLGHQSAARRHSEEDQDMG